MAEAEKKKEKEKMPKYSREALAGSKKYRPLRDVLMVVLDGAREYTMQEVDVLLEKFLQTEIIEKVNRKDDK